MTIRIGCGAGFLGDSLDAPRRLVESAQLDYLTLEYLAELTLSILARNRQKNPTAGYADDLLTVLANLLPTIREQSGLKIVTNGGGVNPLACAKACAKIFVDAGLGALPIGVVTGDDLVADLLTLQRDGWAFANLETGRPLSELGSPVVSANAYLGAQPIAESLAGGARLVLTGRVADASLTLGPAAYEHGWAWDDWNTLAGGTVAGHLIECGAQVTGGYSHRWDRIDLTNVGYPIAEVAADGSCVITKPAGSGGVVDQQTVAAQLLYEIGDPAHYLTPDVDVDFTTVTLTGDGENRVAVANATGRSATDTYKVSLAFEAGYQCSGQLLIFGEDCVTKARAAGKMIVARTNRAGFDLAATQIELLGAGDGVPGRSANPTSGLREVMLRVTARDDRREALERFAREFAPLITSGPAGIAGYAAGRPAVRPVFAYWPTLVPKTALATRVEVRPAQEWM